MRDAIAVVGEDHVDHVELFRAPASRATAWCTCRRRRTAGTPSCDLGHATAAPVAMGSPAADRAAGDLDPVVRRRRKGSGQTTGGPEVTASSATMAFSGISAAIVPAKASGGKTCRSPARASVASGIGVSRGAPQLVGQRLKDGDLVFLCARKAYAQCNRAATARWVCPDRRKKTDRRLCADEHQVRQAAEDFQRAGRRHTECDRSAAVHGHAACGRSAWGPGAWPPVLTEMRCAARRPASVRAPPREDQHRWLSAAQGARHSRQCFRWRRVDVLARSAVSAGAAAFVPCGVGGEGSAWRSGLEKFARPGQPRRPRQELRLPLRRCAPNAKTAPRESLGVRGQRPHRRDGGRFAWSPTTFTMGELAAPSVVQVWRSRWRAPGPQ